MSFSFGFYNALNHDRLYDAIQVSEIFDGLIRDGVYSTIGDHYVVKASENENEVIVGSGRAWFDHTWNKNDADLPIAAPLPDLLMKRYDALVIDINANVASRTNQITWVEGTPSLNTPVKPTLTNTTDHHQYPLCYILRTANNNTIIQDDIENTIGTDECPFVTGILQQVSISDLLLQWTSQFATFMNNNEATASAWEAEWEASMNQWTVEQKNEFATWMAGEKTEFDDWFANLHYILDGDVAGHLQNEIDAIEEGLGGSVFTIHTINSSLYGKTVTCTGSTQEKTAVFDASGNAEIKGITDVGTITFTATDGSQTATTQISVPYFSNYPITMAFWAATVNLSTTSEDLKGKTITIRKGGAVVASTSFNSAGTATYIATSAGTYTFTCQGYSVEQAITEETTYNVSINSGLDLSAWITAGSTTDYPLNPSSYANFAALEADEEAIRQLMLVHNAVDYLATAGADDALIEDVINSDICAKWINLSDYALDTLSANANIKSVMDEADKYGYGEWGLVGQVPTLSADSSSVIKSSQFDTDSNAAWKAFAGIKTAAHGTGDAGWYTSPGETHSFIGYIFANAIKITDVYLRRAWYTAKPNAKMIIQGSNDTTTGSDGTWTDLTDEVDVLFGSSAENYVEQNVKITKNIGLYKAYRVYHIGVLCPSSTSGSRMQTLQFYAYEPLGNVPIMTANNAPYGEASGDGSYHYKAFDNNYNTNWEYNYGSLSQIRLAYKFNNPVNVKGFKYLANANSAKTLKVQASNDGSNWIDLTEILTYEVSGGSASPTVDRGILNITKNQGYYLYYSILITSSYSSSQLRASILQFYGRELTGNIIPKMTSNTVPKGVASTNSVTTGDAYNAFDGNDSTFWYKYNPSSTISGGVYVQYELEEPTDLKGFGEIIGAPGTGSTVPFKVQALKNSTWTTLYTGSFPANSNPTKYKFTFTPITGVEAVRYFVDNPPKNGNNYIYGTVYRLAFLDSDYSEKEFAQGSTRKTIYDHGVEPSGAITGGTKNPDCLTLSAIGTAVVTIDKGTCTYMGGKAGLHASGTNRLKCGSGYSAFTASNMPDSNGFDISSISGNVAIGIEQTASGTFDCTEIWLE